MSQRIKLYLYQNDSIIANISWLVCLSNDKNIVDFDIKVYDPKNQLITSSVEGERNTETVEFKANKTGYYEFEIYRYDKNNIKRDIAFTYDKK